MNVAQIILNQIKAGNDIHGNSGTHMMMCWGARKFQAIENGLRFTVSGAKHKGFVEVTLDPSDTYSIECYTLRKKRNEFSIVRKTSYKSEMIYCDQLADIIDGVVETGVQ